MVSSGGFTDDKKQIRTGLHSLRGKFCGRHTRRAGARHANLMAAQDLINRAYDRLTAAQQANEWDMGGHAARAKDLLDQAKHEIREATEAANHHGH